MFGQGEWYMTNAGINCHEYAKAASGFYPIRFDAKEWVSAIKEAGAKYICFTTRHHDGFSMFDTKYSDYNIVDATPFKRDVVKELAEECKNQLTELLTNYGPIGAIWFDGMWDQPDDFDWRLDEQYSLIHKLQPACMIGNNHHKKPIEGEDFQMFERDLPGENKAGLSSESEIGQLPLETCQTMNGMWGYKIQDQNYKSVSELIRLLVKASGKGANLLMNVGPQPNGEIPAVALERLKGMGEWLSKYGETVYGTTRGDVMTADWGTTTRKGNTLYVHILTDNMPQFVTLPLKDKVVSAVNLNTGTKISYEKIKGGIVLHTDNLEPEIDCIVKLKLK